MTIILKDIMKSFDGHLTVNKVSLTVSDGELFVLLGGSGSGKSTLLRIIAGLLQPESGTVELNGRDVTRISPQKREIGFVFQNYAIFKHMSVSKNVEFGLRIRKVPKPDRERRCKELLELVGLAGLGARFPDQLSGGQRQRVALARALAYEPTVLLLDEPFGALDLRIRGQLRRSLKEIQRYLKITTILVTHDQEEAFEIGDRIGVLERGRLVEVAQAPSLYYHPQSELGATFIGGGNVLVGRYEKGHIRLGENLIPLPPNPYQHDEGAPVRILFRPEMVLHQSTPFLSDSGVYTLGLGRVVEKIFCGAIERIRLEVENLQGVRPPAASVMYGQRFAHLEAARLSDRMNAKPLAVGDERWIGISEFHVLQPSSVRVLAVFENIDLSRAGAEIASQLASASHGLLSLLAIAPSPHSGPKTQETVEELRNELSQSRELRADIRVRYGNKRDQILLEAQEYYYDMVVLSHTKATYDPRDGLGTTARALLRDANIPVLLVSEPRAAIKKILVCTAGGEPGKNDVRITGRIGLHTGASVCVLHVRRPDSTAGDMKYIERHLSQAQATLDAFHVPNTVKIGTLPLLEEILKELEEGDYDLLVVGATVASIPMHTRAPDLAGRIAQNTKRPVLIVPMKE